MQIDKLVMGGNNKAGKEVAVDGKGKEVTANRKGKEVATDRKGKGITSGKKGNLMWHISSP